MLRARPDERSFASVRPTPPIGKLCTAVDDSKSIDARAAQALALLARSQSQPKCLCAIQHAHQKTTSRRCAGALPGFVRRPFTDKRSSLRPGSAAPRSMLGPGAALSAEPASGCAARAERSGGKLAA
jgi:hypothetical protein